MFSKEKVVCPRSQQLRRHAIFELSDQISLHEKVHNSVFSVHMGPKSNLLSKRYAKNLAHNCVSADLDSALLDLSAVEESNQPDSV